MLGRLLAVCESIGYARAASAAANAGNYKEAKQLMMYSVKARKKNVKTN